MNRPVELAEGVWVLHNAESGRSTGILVDDLSAVIIDPTGDKSDLDVIDKGLDEQGRVVEAVVFTHDVRSDDISLWPSARRVTAGIIESGAPIPIPGPLESWEVMPLGEQAAGRLALYSKWHRLLFCGELLADTAANEAIPSLVDGSRWYIDALGVIKGLDVKLLVPSRGSTATGKRSIRKRIEADHNYVYDVRRLVISSIMGEASLERVLAVTADLHEDYPLLEAHLANIRGVWTELSSKAAPGE